MLTLYFDFKSPPSYLALKPTLALAERSDTRIDWQPFRSRERDLPDNRTDDTVSIRHQRVRRAARRRMHRHYAALQGLEMRFRNGPDSADLALGALALIPGLGEDFVLAAFDAYWRGGVDLNAPADVQALLDTRSCAHQPLDAAAARAALTRAQSEAEARGIVDAPAYLIDGQVFIGREHLPWIEELLHTTP